MNFGRKTAVTTTALILSTLPVYANHGLDAMGDALEILFFILLGVLVLTGINFVIAVRNISRKSSGMRVLSIILSLPLVVASLMAFTIAPIAGFIGIAIVVILWMTIYKSWEPKDAEGV